MILLIYYFTFKFSFTERAIEIFESYVNKSNPFFMYFASQNVHAPLEVLKKGQNI